VKWKKKRCKTCHKWFEENPLCRGVQKFCCRKCLKDFYKPCYKQRRCKSCGHWFKPKQKNSKVCSKSCSHLIEDRNFWRTRKIKCVEYKGGKCLKCGYDKCLAALEFHHRKPKYKNKLLEGNRAFSIKGKWNELKKELNKCDLLCANCHREVHAREK